MCLSILPGQIRAGSSQSMWFVVNMKTLSLPHADHSLLTKLSRPDSVTLLFSSFLSANSTSIYMLVADFVVAVDYLVALALGSEFVLDRVNVLYNDDGLVRRVKEELPQLAVVLDGN
ncbi:Os12g0472366 [Oryza sativa Japonica Group]|uniref:Os12g0472366 protein n=1 Tax=Oryza sativa subsp. japonica TaxID=39947 RepID=A0A0P0Y9Y2_ORYSJ|nr:Os12g0472366 [Oryza sativa Japonica Group]